MRIRTLKPEFWTHPRWGRQPDDVRLLAVALLNFADDRGFFYASAELVRTVMPFWPAEKLTRALGALEDLGWIELQDTPQDGPIGRVVNFGKHQRIDRPTASRIAPMWREYDEGTSNPRRGPVEGSSPDQGSEGVSEQGAQEGVGSVSRDCPSSLRPFHPPAVDEVREYCRQRGNSVDPERFVAHYTSKGWRVGNCPMKDWRAAVRTWERSERRRPGDPPRRPPEAKQVEPGVRRVPTESLWT
jgi:hypothetical protein